MIVPPSVLRRARRHRRQQAQEQAPAGRHDQLQPTARDESRRYVNEVSLAAGLLALAAGLTGTGLLAVADRPVPALLSAVAAVLACLYLTFAIKIARQWEKAVVLRVGRFRGLRGPGLFWVIPVVDTLAQLVDQRVRATDVTAESALTRDTVPVDVDAIVFWTVWDAEKSVLEVENYFNAVFLSAQTALREAIGRHDLAEMITERDKLGHQLQHILDEKTNPWGITVQSVEIRDVQIPQDLEDAMSRQAQAERERQARIILGTAETEIADKFAAASVVYQGNGVALHLRAMNMLYEGLKSNATIMVVLVPSTAVETMGLGALSGVAALAGAEAPRPGPAAPPARAAGS
jgi:regulator of protease activity HflC (stomatin/prohibitin superfamily)